MKSKEKGKIQKKNKTTTLRHWRLILQSKYSDNAWRLAQKIQNLTSVFKKAAAVIIAMETGFHWSISQQR